MPYVVSSKYPILGNSGAGSGSQAYASQSSFESQIKEKIGSIEELHAGANAASCVSKINEIINKMSAANLLNGTSESSQSSQSSQSI
jgi:hypothetical protein